MQLGFSGCLSLKLKKNLASVTIMIEKELMAVAFLNSNAKNPYTMGMAIPPPPTPAIVEIAMKIEKVTVPTISMGLKGKRQFPSQPYPASVSGHSSPF